MERVQSSKYVRVLNSIWMRILRVVGITQLAFFTPTLIGPIFLFMGIVIYVVADLYGISIVSAWLFFAGITNDPALLPYKNSVKAASAFIGGGIVLLTLPFVTVGGFMMTGNISATRLISGILFCATCVLEIWPRIIIVLRSAASEKVLKQQQQQQQPCDVMESQKGASNNGDSDAADVIVRPTRQSATMHGLVVLCCPITLVFGTGVYFSSSAVRPIVKPALVILYIYYVGKFLLRETVARGAARVGSQISYLTSTTLLQCWSVIGFGLSVCLLVMEALILGMLKSKPGFTPWETIFVDATLWASVLSIVCESTLMIGNASGT